MRAVTLPLTIAALLIAGCATAPTGPAQVTRFHTIDMVVGGGMVRLDELSGTSLADAPYRAAVAQALARAGYRAVTDEEARRAVATGSPPPLRAQFQVETARLDRARGGSGVGVGVGGSTGSYGSGVGVGVGLDLTRLLRGPGHDTVVRLSVRLLPEGNATPLWEGRAETHVAARTATGQPAVVAERLANALFAGFPGRSGETITVP